MTYNTADIIRKEFKRVYGFMDTAWYIFPKVDPDTLKGLPSRVESVIIVDYNSSFAESRNKEFQPPTTTAAMSGNRP